MTRVSGSTNPFLRGYWPLRGELAPVLVWVQTLPYHLADEQAQAQAKSAGTSGNED
jgi:hypothetical protein